jgi:hypothetical protein
MNVRDQLPPDRVCDLQYEEVRRDPIAATRRVYAFFGWSLEREVEEKMRAVLRTQNGNGEHRYNAEYFGLNNTGTFAEYCERFGFNGSAATKKRERVEAAA